MADVPEEDTGKKKITHLLLNTPGSCFLCLQDNEIDEGGPLEDLNGGIINLSRICRFLNIQCSLMSTGFKNYGGPSFSGVGGDVGQQLCSFSVKLCPKCLELTEKLNDMIIQLEKAKLMVNYYLDSFHKVLKTDDTEESLEWINLLGRMHASSNNSFEAKLVQLLREETRDKSLKILKKAEPQLILSKCSVSTPPVPSFPPGTLPSIKHLLKHLAITNEVPSKKSRSAKLYRCPHCAKTTVLSKFAIHLACLHSDKLLSSHFPPAQPPSEPICRKVLYSHVIAKATKIPSPSTPTAPRLACHVCGITYSDGTLLKHHFLTNHTENLIEAIVNFEADLKNESFIKPSNKKRRPIKSPAAESVRQLIKNLSKANLISEMVEDNTAKVIKKSRCPFCEQVIGTSKFALHLTTFHSDKMLESPAVLLGYDPKAIHDDPNDFSELCNKILKAESAKCKKVSGGSGGAEGASKLSCYLCTNQYKDPRNLRNHFIVGHTDILCKQLIEPQNIGTNTNPDKKLTRIINKPLKTGRRSVENKKCTICRVTFSRLGKLRRHQATHHPDQIFLECKPSWMGGDEFKGICKEIFRKEVGGATYGKPGSKIYKCGYCPGGMTSYKGQADLVAHLAYQHREEMEGKLRKDNVEGMEEEEGDRFYFEGGEGEQEGGGGDVVVEEDGSEFDVKPDIGLLEELLYPDMVLDEVASKEEMEVDDGNLEFLQQQYGYFEEGEDGTGGGGGGGDYQIEGGMVIGNGTEEPSEN